MSNLPVLARVMILFGILLVLAGIGVLILAHAGLPRIPGDILVRRRNLVVYIPVASALVLSVVLTVVLNLLRR